MYTCIQLKNIISNINKKLKKNKRYIVKFLKIKNNHIFIISEDIISKYKSMILIYFISRNFNGTCLLDKPNNLLLFVKNKMKIKVLKNYKYLFCLKI